MLILILLLDEKDYEIANLVDDNSTISSKVTRLENDINNMSKNNNNDKIIRANMEHTFFLEKESLNSKVFCHYHHCNLTIIITITLTTLIIDKFTKQSNPNI